MVTPPGRRGGSRGHRRVAGALAAGVAASTEGVDLHLASGDVRLVLLVPEVA